MCYILQTPFVTLFLELDDNDPYVEETADIIEEILKQRILGLKNEKGVYITPTFPKLIYLLDENNNLSGGRFDYITKLAGECSAKRMYPDYISAKKMRENYEGEVFSPMGCSAGDEIITYRYNGKLIMESFEKMWLRLAERFSPERQIPGKPHLYMDLKGIEIYDSKNGFVNVKRIIRNVSKNWMRVTIAGGRTVVCTTDHPFYTTNRGRVYAKDLTLEDSVIINKSQYSEETMYKDPDTAWSEGFIICDGCYDGGSIMACIDINGEDEIAKKLSDVLAKNGDYLIEVNEQHRGKKGDYKELKYRRSSGIEISKKKAQYASLFRGFKKVDREVPEDILSWNKEARYAFLAGMIDADGYLNLKSGAVQIGSTNKALALEQMRIAESLDMPSSVYTNHYSSKHPEKIRYQVSFYPDNKLIEYMQCKKKIDNFTGERSIEGGLQEAKITKLEYLDDKVDFSYDVTTESDFFEFSGMYSHNCRSFLSPWKDEDGNYKWEGRMNMGVVSLNLPQIAILAEGDKDTFWKILDDRLELCKEALLYRYKHLKGTTSDIAPIHWQHGSIARLEPGEKIDKYLEGGYATISLGYIGVYEMTKLMTGESHTTGKGKEFALKVMNYLRNACKKWKRMHNLGFGLYGTPAESLCYRFAKIDKERFGDIPDITDKGYYTNSYHVDVREEISAFDKLSMEAEFQPISTGGCISYVEIPNMKKNMDVIYDLIKYIYDNIQYAEFNTKSDYCMECGWDGEIIINDDNEWECPQCGNKNHAKMNVTRRTCGYLGANFWNVGKTKEIKSRVLHL